MLSTISTPVLLILALVIGVLVGLLLSSLFNREPKTSGENPLPEKLSKEGYAEYVRLLYSPAIKKIVTYLDDDYYDDFATLTPDQKKRVLRLLSSWSEWGGVTPKTTGQAANPATVTTPAPVAETLAAAVKVPPLPETPERSAFKTEDNLDLIPGLVQKSESLEDLGIVVPEPVAPIPAVISFSLGGPAKIPEKPKTIVEQINAKLEELMVETSSQNKGLRLEDNGHQGVVVWVGIERYDGVDAVPYPDAQKLIKEAVARWEEDSEKAK